MGGYDAGYYVYFYLISCINLANSFQGYMWSLAFATDMFKTVFAKDPMNKAEGRRYRQMVLEKGGSQDEMKTLEEFLGRKPSPEAFYQELGLA